MAKLVEILAKRLLAWPEMAVIAVQDADGELKFSEDSSAHIDIPEKVWIRGGVLGFREDGRIGEVADDYRTAIVTRAEWQAAVDALNTPLAIKEEWDGEGLPPVGTVCKIGKGPHHEYVARFAGREAQVIAHSQGVSGDPVAVFSCLMDDNEYEYHALVDYPGNFVRLHTPEQIAAEERKAGIEEMRKTLTIGRGTDWAAFLYDAGYRKQEPK